MNEAVPHSQTCVRCGDTKPFDAAHFHRDAMARYGLKATCRQCSNSAERRRYASNADEILERARKRRSERAAYWETQAHWNAA